MKKTLTIIILLAVLILPACSNNNENVISVNTETTVKDADGEDVEIAKDFSNISINQLGNNIFFLEESDYSVSAEQAEEMLVLWQVAKSLIESSVAAEAELTAVTNQIVDILSDEQIEYLLTIDFENQGNIGQLLAEYGYIDPKSGLDENGERIDKSSGDALSAIGAMPGGGSGGGGGKGSSGQDLTPEQQATREAKLEEFGGAGFGMNSMIFDAVIELLQSKIQ